MPDNQLYERSLEVLLQQELTNIYSLKVVLQSNLSKVSVTYPVSVTDISSKEPISRRLSDDRGKLHETLRQ